MNLKFREIVQKQVKTVSFHQTRVLSSVSYKVQHLFSTLVLLEMIVFGEDIYHRHTLKFAIRCK